MREIKFRAWHTKQNKMYSCEEMVDDQMTLLTDGRFINVSGDHTYLSQIDNKGVMIPLQFTGLKDKNGREIYEGDILRWENSFNFQIGWSQYKCGFYCEKTSATPDQLPKYCVVIGNIYENPELTK